MTIKLKVLTPKNLDINALIDHAKHGDPEPHGSSRFDLEDRSHNLTLHAKGSGFNYIGDIPKGGSISPIHHRQRVQPPPRFGFLAAPQSVDRAEGKRT